MADINQTIKWIEEGKKVLVNGNETFSGTVDEFLKANFELYEELDNWNLKDCPYNWEEHNLYVNSIQKPIILKGDGYKTEYIETLREKIEKDIENLRKVYMPSDKEVVKDFISIHAIKEILNKRFGF